MKLAYQYRRRVWLLLPVLAFFVMAASGPQCARFDDRVLAPSLSELGKGIGKCIKDCVDAAKAARTAEQERFREAIQSCENGSDCRAREAARHVAIMQEIAQNERDCKAPCHEQGRGQGGQ